MKGLKAKWNARRDIKTEGEESDTGSNAMPASQEAEPRLVVAHFMLGNTYPFTPQDWSTTFDQAGAIGLDGFALNLGPETWQAQQALSAFQVLSFRPPSAEGRQFRLFLSLDMMVLPSASSEDARTIRQAILPILGYEGVGYLRWKGRRVVSTFGGHEASFGGEGWDGFLGALKEELGEEVFFWPSFFLPPETLLGDAYPNEGIFNWNASWRFTAASLSLDSDRPFLTQSPPNLPSPHHRSRSHGTAGHSHRKAYMTAVSPLFFTHYGTTGPWAWNKNWIYPADDLLYPTRWHQLLSLPPDRSPDIVQVISWNDHGESHGVAPVLGALPGCERWMDGMDHVAFREMTGWYAAQWRDGLSAVEALQVVDPLCRGIGDDGKVVKVWMWYRTHSKDAVAKDDDVGRPDRADLAEDLINVLVITPANGHADFTLFNGPHRHTRRLERGKANAFTIPFVPGAVGFELNTGERNIVSGKCQDIDAEIEKYNFNIWSGSWSGGV